MELGDLSHNGKTGSIVFVALSVGIVLYTVLTALNGDYGLLRLYQIKSLEVQYTAQLQDLNDSNAAISNKIRRLSWQRPDIELLDSRARSVLGLGHANEIVIE